MNTFRTEYERGDAFYEGPDDGFIKVDVKDVGSSVQSFAREVANKLWNIEFYVSDLWPPHQTTKLYIHTKGQPFFLGNIYREGDKFGVWSRRINNNKKPNASESVNFKTALRNAAKHLQLWDVAELAGRPAYKYALERRKRIQAVSSEAMDALTRIGVVNEKAPVLKYLLTEINGNRYVGEELRADVDLSLIHI